MNSLWGSFFLVFLGVFIPFRSFEESQTKPKTHNSQLPVINPTSTSTTTRESFIKIWPGSHEDAGVLILSDSDSDDN